MLPFSFNDILASERVLLGLKVSSKKKMLQKFANVVTTGTPLNENHVFRVLLAREKLGSTGIGKGVAVPHGRIVGLDHVMGLFATLAFPIPFEAIDDKPVDLVFLLLAPESEITIDVRALARISRLLSDERLCNQLRSAKSQPDLYSLLANSFESRAA